jgi:hypothetical protein
VTTKIAGDRKKLFHLREYDAAFLKVFSRVIHLRAEEAYPLLKEIPNGAAPSHPHVTGHVAVSRGSDRDISRVVPYPPLTDADRPAYEALMARRRKEPGARRRPRTLS